jgi:hypothetical protein
MQHIPEDLHASARVCVVPRANAAVSLPMDSTHFVKPLPAEVAIADFRARFLVLRTDGKSEWANDPNASSTRMRELLVDFRRFSDSNCTADAAACRSKIDQMACPAVTEYLISRISPDH